MKRLLGIYGVTVVVAVTLVLGFQNCTKKPAASAGGGSTNSCEWGYEVPACTPTGQGRPASMVYGVRGGIAHAYDAPQQIGNSSTLAIGWVLDLDTPQQPVDVQVFVDDCPFGAFTANGKDDAIAELKFGVDVGPYHHFKLRLHDVPPGQHKLTLKVQDPKDCQLVDVFCIKDQGHSNFAAKGECSFPYMITESGCLSDGSQENCPTGGI